MKRLHKAGVVSVLRQGRKIRTPSFDMQFINVRAQAGVGARIAISTPKKLLPTAVARNRVKRLVREAFRNSDASGKEYDLLLQFRLKNDCRLVAARRRIRVELAELLGRLSFSSKPA